MKLLLGVNHSHINFSRLFLIYMLQGGGPWTTTYRDTTLECMFLFETAGHKPGFALNCIGEVENGTEWAMSEMWHLL